MARSIQVALTDILNAIDLAREAALDTPFEAFERNRILKAATERALLTISEAVRHLPDELLARHPELEWQDMKSIGNRLRHEYWIVDAKIVWEVVQHDLNALERVVRDELVIQQP
jgi:uncharacterized protein with HEPN domain